MCSLGAHLEFTENKGRIRASESAARKDDERRVVHDAYLAPGSRHSTSQALYPSSVCLAISCVPSVTFQPSHDEDQKASSTYAENSDEGERGRNERQAEARNGYEPRGHARRCLLPYIMVDVVVPVEVTAEITQTLLTLILGDDAIRQR